MGMFDYVAYEGPCPYCGAHVSGFQSKDAGCDLATVPLAAVNHFYAPCGKCQAWVEYARKPATALNDFDLIPSQARL